MAKTPKYGNPIPDPTGASDNGPMGIKIAIGVAVTALLATIIVFAVKDSGGDVDNSTAFQPATVVGDVLPGFDQGSADTAVGQTIPTINGKTFEGEELSIEPGEPMLIAMLAHWCSHCQAEVPRIVEWQNSADFPEDLKIVGVSTAADEVRGNFPPAEWLAREEFNNDVLVDDPTGKVMAAFGGQSFPTLVAVKADGTVAKRSAGELSSAQLEEMGEAALGNADEDAAPIVDDGEGSSPVPE